MNGLTTAQSLQLGIEAAQAGQNNLAVHHLTAVLAQEPHNIPAMLWLASALPSPQDSLYWLKRVLALDPANERARAGLHWARGRLELPPDEFERSSQPQAQTVPTAPDVSVQPTIPSQPIQNQPDHGVPAPLRWLIDPFLLIVFLMSGLGPLAAGLGVLAFMPADTLAAWLPIPLLSDERDLTESALAVSPIPPPEAVVTHSTVEADTLIIEAPQVIEPVGAGPDATGQSAGPEAAPGMSPPASPPASSTDPALLVGPELPLALIDRVNLAHQPAYPGEKWIEVNVTGQQVTAWEGDLPVMSFKASTGQSKTPTVLGEFYIYWKLESGLMAGPGYSLPEVPYIMYFYEGYALHGTYWHNYFGHAISRGCVNLQTDNAEKLFEWAGPVVPPDQAETVATYENPGTLVVVHE